MAMNPDIVLLDLFSGIGGFSKGLEEAGFNIVKHYFSEIDKYAIANYRYNFKNAEYVGSVVDVRGREIERPNIITFGSPCQDFSLAGKRNGLDGNRSSLVLEAIRLIRECQPDVFIWENVKGAFSSNAGADFWAILQAFANIGGYRLEWQLLNTSWFLPQNRERIYLIGCSGNTSIGKIFPFRENDKIFREAQGEAQGEGQRIWGYNSQANTISKRTYKDGSENLVEVKALTEARTEEAKQIRKESQKDGKDFSPRRGKKLVERKDNNSNTITSTQTVEQLIKIGNIYPSGGENGNIYSSKGLSPSLKSGVTDNKKNGGIGSSNSPKIQIEERRIRRLTETECERLQGFPDGWTKYGMFEGIEKEISKTQRYKMLGNAVSVPVVKAIGERLLNTQK